MKHYRIVSDFGYGDKSWLHRMVPENKVIALLREASGYKRDPDTIEQAEEQDFMYYIEEDNENDIEDWDWEDF